MLTSHLKYIYIYFLLQKLDPAQLRKIQSVDGGLGIPVARNCSGLQSPKMSNGTGTSHALPKPPSGPTLIEESFKKVKKPIPQPQSRSSTPAPSNGLSKPDTDKRSNSEGRGLPSSTSLKSLSDSSSADTSSDSKVSPVDLSVCLSVGFCKAKWTLTVLQEFRYDDMGCTILGKKNWHCDHFFFFFVTIKNTGCFTRWHE